MGCQKAIATQLVQQESDYVLAVKENQPQLHEDILSLFATAEQDQYHNVAHDTYTEVDKGHGRIETRTTTVITQKQDYVDYVRYERKRDGSIKREVWTALTSLVRVESQRLLADKQQTETRYYISSLDATAQRLGEAVRSHWDIENGLHWVLDVAFREDDSRLRKGNGPQNFAIVRRLALNLLRQENEIKVGVKTKRLKAGWDNNYLIKVLNPK